MASIEDKRRLIQEIDSDFDITFNVHTESYLITHKRNTFQVIPYGEFTKETLDHIRKVVCENINGDIVKRIDADNEKVHEANERIQDDIIHETAKDLAKAIRG